MVDVRGSALTMKALLFLSVLQACCQASYCIDSPCYYKFMSFSAVNGQNISVRFNVKKPLQNTQYLKWMHRSSHLIGIYNNSKQHSRNVDNTRFKLIEGFQNNSYVISIELTQKSDSGKHALYIYEGSQSICMALNLYLRIDNTDPTCTILLNNNNGKVELSCRWVQVDNGDYAQILTGDRVAAKDETAISLRGSFYSQINTFSIYTTMKNVLAGNEPPLKCLIFHSHKNVSKTCAFLSMMQYTIRNERSEQFAFERCCHTEHVSRSWWYNVGGGLLPLEFRQMYTFSNTSKILFIRVEGFNDSNVIGHAMEILDLADYSNSAVSFLVESFHRTKLQAYSTEYRRCENFTVTINVSVNSLASTSTQKSTTEDTYSVTQNANSKAKIWLCTMAVIIALALGLVIGICLSKISGIVLRKEGTLCHHRGSATGVAEESLEMASISSQPLRPDNVPLSCETVSNQHLLNMKSEDPQLSFLQSVQCGQSSCPVSQDLLERGGTSKSQAFTTYRDTDLESSNKTKLTGKICGSTYNDKGNIDKKCESEYLSSVSSLESTYCSVDDSEVATLHTKAANFPSSSNTTSMVRSLRPDGQEINPRPGKAKDGNPSCVMSSRSREHTSVLSIEHLEALYAKPDMSRKTGKVQSIVPSEIKADQTKRLPLADAWKTTSQMINRIDPVTENGSDDPDILKDGPIYGNHASILNPCSESNWDHALYMNSPGVQYN